MYPRRVRPKTPGHAAGHGLQQFVEHVHSAIERGPADRRRGRAVVGQAAPPCRVDGALGRAVEITQPARGRVEEALLEVVEQANTSGSHQRTPASISSRVPATRGGTTTPSPSPPVWPSDGEFRCAPGRAFTTTPSAAATRASFTGPGRRRFCGSPPERAGRCPYGRSATALHLARWRSASRRGPHEHRPTADRVTSRCQPRA